MSVLLDINSATMLVFFASNSLKMSIVFDVSCRKCVALFASASLKIYQYYLVSGKVCSIFCEYFPESFSNI